MTTKRCFRCTLHKPLTDFPANKNFADGYGNECKECKKVRDREYRSRPEVKARRLQWHQENRDNYKGRYSYEIDWKKYSNTTKAWHDRNPNASRAYNMLRGAIRKGAIPKVSECLCSQCGKAAEDYHHPNGYDPGHELDVVPLCKSCHQLTHGSHSQP